MFQQPFYIPRQGTPNFVRALKKGEVTIGFIGGSITDPATRSRWSDFIVYELCAKYPEVSFHVVNTAISATNSLHAVYRAEKDLLTRNCDLIFIEFAVNDRALSKELRRRSEEGLLRKLWNPNCDLVFAYTFDYTMLDCMLNGKLFATMEDMEELAEHYEIPTVFMSCYALDCVKRGLLRYEEWVPDGVHPENCGSRFYAKPVMDFLESQIQNPPANQAKETMPSPIVENNLEKGYIIPYEQIQKKGAWFDQRPNNLALVDTVLSSFAIGSSLKFTFEGTGVTLCMNFGSCAADFKYRIDEGEWKEYHWDRPDSIKATSGIIFHAILADDLAKGAHTAEIELIMPSDPRVKGCNFDMAYVGIMP